MIYSENGSLETVYVSKGKVPEALELYRVLSYYYGKNVFPSKTEYFDLVEGHEVQAFEVKYFYR